MPNRMIRVHRTPVGIVPTGVFFVHISVGKVYVK